jgi:hypothetical protein
LIGEDRNLIGEDRNLIVDYRREYLHFLSKIYTFAHDYGYRIF